VVAELIETRQTLVICELPTVTPEYLTAPAVFGKGDRYWIMLTARPYRRLPKMLTGERADCLSRVADVRRRRWRNRPCAAPACKTMLVLADSLYARAAA